MELTAKAIREFLGKRTRANLDEVADDAPLLTSGLIDSYAMVDLMTFLQKQTGARVAPEDLERLDSVQAIRAFAAEKSKR